MERKDAKEVKCKIENIVLEIKVKAGENGKIFGGVTSKEISEELKNRYSIQVDKKKIILKETIKTLGRFNIEIKLYEDIVANLVLQINAM